VAGPAYRHGPLEIPAVQASASRAADGRIHVSLCNTDPQRPIEVTAAVQGVTARKVSGRVLTAATMQAHNTFAQPQAVVPTALDGARLIDGGVVATLPAKSVVVLAIE